MKRTLINQPAIFIIILSLSGCTAEHFQYPDRNRPGLVPELFSPNFISLPNRFEQNITFDRTGTEYYYGVSDSADWWYRSILRTRVLKGGQTMADTPDIIKNFQFAKDKFIGEPFLTADGKELYFVAGLPPDIWLSKRANENGEWSKPVLLDTSINSSKGEWNPALSKRGTLYFASTRTDSGRIYKAVRTANGYHPVEMLKGGINDDDAGDPCISPDESFIVFSSWKPGGFGGTDLYVSQSNQDGTWSSPVNLGNTINTAQEEAGPRISPDGKYLFFHRRDKWQHAAASDIYWVRIEVVKRLIKQR